MIELSDQYTQLTLTPNLPGRSRTKQWLTAKVLSTSKEDWELVAQYFETDGMELISVHIPLKQNLKLNIKVAEPLYLMIISLENDLNFSFKSIGAVNLSTHEFNLFFVPSLEASISCTGKNNHLFIVRFAASLLKSLAANCNKLHCFMNKAAENQPARLSEKGKFLTPEIVRIIYSMLRYDQAEALAANYYNSLFHAFMVLMVNHVNMLANQPACHPVDIKHAQEAHHIIVSDFELYHTVEELAALTGSTKLKLQRAFRYVYGSTVRKFSRKARLERGYELLSTTAYPLRTICLMVGYDDQSNFSFAFRNEYGCWPGYIQKMAKERAKMPT